MSASVLIIEGASCAIVRAMVLELRKLEAMIAELKSSSKRKAVKKVARWMAELSTCLRGGDPKRDSAWLKKVLLVRLLRGSIEPRWMKLAVD